VEIFATILAMFVVGYYLAVNISRARRGIDKFGTTSETSQVRMDTFGALFMIILTSMGMLILAGVLLNGLYALASITGA
jgi:hypothetical protein